MRGMLLWIVLAAVAWLPPSDAHGRDVFVWRDAHGIAHFSDRPGVPNAERVDSRTAYMSIIETKVSRDNPLRPLVDHEINWQKNNRRQQQRKALADMARQKVFCDRLREQVIDADEKRQRPRLLKLEEKWFRQCR